MGLRPSRSYGGIGKVEWRLNGVTLGVDTRGLVRTDRPGAPSIGRTSLWLIDLGAGRNRLGGSALAQVYGEVGETPADLDDPRRLKAFAEALTALKDSGCVLAYHDRSDGGLFTTLVEMAFAGHCGLDVVLPAPSAVGALAALFAVILAVPLALAPSATASADTAGVTVTYVESSRWDSGYGGQLTIDNASDTALTDWTVEFTLPSGATITSLWNASHAVSGGTHTLTPPPWGAAVPAGGAYTIGWNGAHTGGGTVPENCLLNGNSCSGEPGEPDGEPPTAPGGLTVTGVTANAVSLSWEAATDNVAVAGYEVVSGGEVVRAVGGDTVLMHVRLGSILYWFLRPIQPRRYHVIRALGDRYGLHPLTIADVVHVHQRRARQRRGAERLRELRERARPEHLVPGRPGQARAPHAGGRRRLRRPADRAVPRPQRRRPRPGGPVRAPAGAAEHGRGGGRHAPLLLSRLGVPRRRPHLADPVPVEGGRPATARRARLSRP